MDLQLGKTFFLPQRLLHQSLKFQLDDTNNLKSKLFSHIRFSKPRHLNYYAVCRKIFPIIIVIVAFPLTTIKASP